MLSSPPGPCVLSNSWRSLNTAATGPTRWPPRLGLTWPRSWRNTPKCLLTMQALMSRCLESVLSFQSHPAALTHHPKPSNVRWRHARFNIHSDTPAYSCFCKSSPHSEIIPQGLVSQSKCIRRLFEEHVIFQQLWLQPRRRGCPHGSNSHPQPVHPLLGETRDPHDRVQGTLH